MLFDPGLPDNGSVPPAVRCACEPAWRIEVNNPKYVHIHDELRSCSRGAMPHISFCLYSSSLIPIHFRSLPINSQFTRDVLRMCLCEINASSFPLVLCSYIRSVTLTGVHYAYPVHIWSLSLSVFSMGLEFLSLPVSISISSRYMDLQHARVNGSFFPRMQYTYWCAQASSSVHLHPCNWMYWCLSGSSECWLRNAIVFHECVLYVFIFFVQYLHLKCSGAFPTL